MDPENPIMFPWISSPNPAIPQGVPTAPIGTPGQGGGRPVPPMMTGFPPDRATVAPPPGWAGSTLMPFMSQSQNVPQWPNPPAAPDQTETPNTATETGGGGDGQGGGKQEDKLLNALRGVKAPERPQAQQVRTPPPPQLAPIKGGEFLGMLTALGIGPQDLAHMQMRLK